jgi:FixJ family two-component response regulator
MQTERSEVRAQVALAHGDVALRRSQAEWLREAGFEVIEFDGARGFLAEEASLAPLGLLLGASAPDVAPAALLAALDERGSPHAVALVGEADAAEALEAIRAGAVDWRPARTAGELVALARRASERAWARGFHLTAAEGELALARLTPREHETLHYVLEGHSSKIIAQQMGVTTKTVEQHRSNVMHKLEVASVAQLVLRALRTRSFGLPYLTRPRRQ